MKKLLWLLSLIIGLAYPFLVFFIMRKYGADARMLVLFLLLVGAVYFLSHSGDRKSGGMKAVQFWGTLLVLSSLALLTFLTKNAGFVKIYPISINLMFLVSFGSTLFFGPNMIFRFARLQDRAIDKNPHLEKIISYCRRVTQVWCLFFIVNGLISGATALWGSDMQWTLYNGFISYVLMGLLFAVEFIIRKLQERKWERS
ncbi:MAG: hypothetical protein PQJ59_03755 [Spirochaetales bacterium]|nr:hypothetical protein [Spirochaetales bacterium]